MQNDQFQYIYVSNIEMQEDLKKQGSVASPSIYDCLATNPKYAEGDILPDKNSQHQ